MGFDGGAGAGVSLGAVVWPRAAGAARAIWVVFLTKGGGACVETRPGAGGAIADEAVARSQPDGHTLLYAAGAITTLPALRAKLPYDVERDFAPISLVVLTVFTLAVHPSVPVRDAQGLIALARARPGQLTFGSPGIGTSGHLAGEAFAMMAGVKMLHVPYKGAPEAIVGVVAGEIDVGVPTVTGALPLVNQGKLKVLAVTTLKRSALMPSVPTLDESGCRAINAPGGTASSRRQASRGRSSRGSTR